MFFYYFACALVKLALLFTFRIRVEGRENVPKNGGAIIAVNHRSNWDVVIVGVKCPRMLRFMAKSELFENPVFGALIKSLGAFPIQRGRGDVGAIKGAMTILKQQHVMLMFPEGKRMRDGKKAQHAKPGVGMIASHTRVPVIPVYIEGEYKWMNKITVKFGKPVGCEEFGDAKLNSEQVQQFSDKVLQSIYMLDSSEKKAAEE